MRIKELRKLYPSFEFWREKHRGIRGYWYYVKAGDITRECSDLAELTGQAKMLSDNFVDLKSLHNAHRFINEEPTK